MLSLRWKDQGDLACKFFPNLCTKQQPWLTTFQLPCFGIGEGWASKEWGENSASQEPATSFLGHSMFLHSYLTMFPDLHWAWKTNSIMGGKHPITIDSSSECSDCHRCTFLWFIGGSFRTCDTYFDLRLMNHCTSCILTHEDDCSRW